MNPAATNIQGNAASFSILKTFHTLEISIDFKINKIRNWVGVIVLEKIDLKGTYSVKEANNTI